MCCSDTRCQINQETEDEGCEDEGDDPLYHCCDILMIAEGRAGENDGEYDLNNYEAEFHPETDAQDAMISVVNTQTLVLSAQENRSKDIAGDEE